MYDTFEDCQSVIEYFMLHWLMYINKDELTIAMFPNEIKILLGDILFRHAEFNSNTLRVKCFFEQVELAPIVNFASDCNLALALSKFSSNELINYGGYYAWDLVTRKRVYL